MPGLSLSARVALVSLAGLGLLGFVSFESYKSTATLEADTRLTDHAFQVIADIERARAELADAQNDERGFLLTGNDSLWRAADSAERHLGRTLAEVREITADEPEQEKRLDTVQSLLGIRLARLDDVMVARKQHGLAAAEAIGENTGAKMNEAILERLDAMARDEFKLLASRDSTLERGASRAEHFTILGGVGLLGLGMVMMANDLRKRTLVQAELKAARDEAREASAAKSAFLATMSHEIRTPMNGVIGMTELLLDDSPTPIQREYLNTVKSSAYALLGVINDILDFSKIEAGRMELEPIPFRLRDSLAGTLKTLATRASQKGLELVCGIAADVPDGLTGDIGRLRQVLLNLVGNAIKFTERGEVALYVIAQATDQGQVTLRFTVQDTGIGIPHDKQQSVFEAFTQADRSTTRRYGGTGLGLTISSQLVALFGGRIWVESEPRVGSKFHFTAQFGRGDEAATPVPTEIRGAAVLLVDDNATNRRVLSEMLGNWGLSVTAADGGTAALDLLLEAKQTGRRFDVAILDLLMPGMDGYELAQRMAETSRDTVRTVMMLSSAGTRDHDKAASGRITEFLTKPVSQSDLLEAIQRGVARTGAGPAPVRETSRPVTARERTGIRVLLAEDNPVNRMVAKALLEKRGHAVSIAENGRLAVEAVGRERWDVVLMDVEMPEMDGLEATRLIRSKETGGQRLPIVALTAHAMKGDAERFMAAGMDHYISKPIRVEELVNLLARLFPA